MRNTRTLAIALAAGTMLLATACSKGGGEDRETTPVKVETPVDGPSNPAVEPSAPVETKGAAAPETKAPAGK